MSESNEAPVCTFFKKKRNLNIRKTETNIEEKKIKLNKQVNEDSDSNKSDDEDENDDEVKTKQDDTESDNSDTDLAENLKEIKKKFNKKGSHLTQSTKFRKKNDDSDEDELKNKDLVVTFKADKNQKRTGPADMGATATYELDTEFDRDTQATFERAKKINEELKGKSSDDKIYRGANNYQQFYEQRDTAQGIYTYIYDMLIYL